jgi:membrane protease YdiL (CAAX protease family)
MGRLTVTTTAMRVGWFVLAGLLALAAYAANFAASNTTTDDKHDLLYKWSSAVAGGIQYAIIAGIVYVLARQLAPSALGLQRPESWGKAIGYAAAALVTVFVLGAVLNIFLKAGEEQGLVPDRWEASKAAPFVANFVVVAVVAPVVEELTYRGLGFAVLRDMYGQTAAIVGCGLAFGLAHGLFVALPILSIFGMILAWLRVKTTSIYPSMLLHATFNAIALIVAVAGGGSL